MHSQKVRLHSLPSVLSRCMESPRWKNLFSHYSLNVSLQLIAEHNHAFNLMEICLVLFCLMKIQFGSKCYNEMGS